MNKTLKIICLAIFLISGKLFSQDKDMTESITIGVKIGTNFSNVWDSEGEEFRADSKFGFVIGANLGIPVLKYFGVQPELLFSQKGFKGSGKILGSEYEFSRTSNFIDLPILISFKPIQYVTILAGPQYSYLIQQTDEFTEHNLTVDQIKEFDNDNIRNNIFCILTGIDANFDNSVIGLRLGWDVTKNNGDGTSYTPRYKNIWWQLTYGYRFGS